MSACLPSSVLLAPVSYWSSGHWVVLELGASDNASKLIEPNVATPRYDSWLNFLQTRNAQTCCLAVQCWEFYFSSLLVAPYCGWRYCHHEFPEPSATHDMAADDDAAELLGRRKAG